MNSSRQSDETSVWAASGILKEGVTHHWQTLVLLALTLYLICVMVKSRYIGDGHPTFNRNPYNGYINPYYWVDSPIPYYMEIMGL